jgi:hypothetical protein
VRKVGFWLVFLLLAAGAVSAGLAYADAPWRPDGDQPYIRVILVGGALLLGVLLLKPKGPPK